MAGNNFFQRLYSHYMRRDGTVVGVYFLTPDGKKSVDGVLVATQTSLRQIIFDSGKWQVKPGVDDSVFAELEGLRTVYLRTSSAKNGEDLPQICLESLMPKEGIEPLPDDVKTKWDMWIRADCPD